MVIFDYNDTDYIALLHKYAKAMGTTIQNNTLVFTPEYGKGYIRVVLLPNGLQAQLYDYTINRDIFFNRTKSKKEFYILNFDELHIKETITVKIANEQMNADPHLRSAVLLTSSLFDLAYMGKKGTHVRGIKILISKDWIATYLGIRLPDKVLNRYLALKTASFNFEPLDTDYRHLMNETFEAYQQTNPMMLMVVQNRLMLLVERFFTRLYTKMSVLTDKNQVADAEIQRLMTVEALLVKDFSQPPPSLPDLARTAMMSQSKLKLLFKKVYSSSPYEYYQKNRMLRAKYLLTTRKYSIKQVGAQLGFQNLSNFTIAYKKEFGMLPSDV